MLWLALNALPLPPGSIAFHDYHNMDQSEQWQAWLRSQRNVPLYPPPHPTSTDYRGWGAEPQLEEWTRELQYLTMIFYVRCLIASQG
jgi:hypothetical protein